MSVLGDRLQIGDYHSGICRRFDEDHSGVWLDGCLDVQNICSVDKIKFNVVVGENLRKQTGRAAISVIRDDNVLTALDQAQRGIDRGHTGSEGKTKTGAFQSRQVSLERRPRGVLGARVLV